MKKNKSRKSGSKSLTLIIPLGHVVVVSPIVATSPLWMLGSWLFLRDIERLTPRTILGAVCVVMETIAISIVR